MHGTLRHLLRHSWFRIAVATWFAVLCGGAMAVQRSALIAGIADGAGLAGLSDGGARTVLALVAATVGFLVAYAVLKAIGRSRNPVRGATIVTSAPQETDVSYAEPPVDEIIAIPPEAEPEPEPYTEQPAIDREEGGAPLDPELTGISALRRAWLDQTGEMLSPAPAADAHVTFDQDGGAEPAEPNPETAANPAQVTVQNPPTLTELGDRLAQAIVRLERSTHQSVAQSPTAEEDDEGPLLDDEARRAVEQALARLEGFAARS